MQKSVRAPIRGATGTEGLGDDDEASFSPGCNYAALGLRVTIDPPGLRALTSSNLVLLLPTLFSGMRRMMLLRIAALRRSTTVLSARYIHDKNPIAVPARRSVRDKWHFRSLTFLHTYSQGVYICIYKSVCVCAYMCSFLYFSLYFLVLERKPGINKFVDILLRVSAIEHFTAKPSHLVFISSIHTLTQ